MSKPRGFGLYEHLPIWAQNAACSLKGVQMRRERYNAAFWQQLEFLDESQWWSLEDQRQFQTELLQKMILTCVRNRPLLP